MIAGEFGKEAVAEIVFSCRVFSVVRLQCAHQILRVIRPEASLLRVVVDVVLEGFIAFARHGQIAGENVVERGNISGTLNRSVTAQGENPSARPSDISKQQLQNRGGA